MVMCTGLANSTTETGWVVPWIAIRCDIEFGQLVHDITVGLEGEAAKGIRISIDVIWNQLNTKAILVPIQPGGWECKGIH